MIRRDLACHGITTQLEKPELTAALVRGFASELGI